MHRGQIVASKDSRKNKPIDMSAERSGESPCQVARLRATGQPQGEPRKLGGPCSGPKGLWFLSFVAGLNAACSDAAPSSSAADNSAAANAGSGTDAAVAATDAPIDTSTGEDAEVAAEVQVSYKVVTGATKVTKPTTSASYTLTLVGPMALKLGEDGHYDLTIEAGGPVKFLSPKATFTQAQLGTKGLLSPAITSGAAALAYKVTGVVPAAAGKWKLVIDVKDGDSAEFDIEVNQ